MRESEIDMNIPKEYKLISTEDLNGINSKGFYLKHIKSGARIALISNDDDNKVFCIGFRTPPEDSTGVAHIIEHTVLCGSEKYPLKDPFVELVKGSLNTFLNAMTYPDKTVYPVASTNDKDFANLMDVYMDAVFHPNIYKYPEIFRQEGWHYEMESPESDLKINGVVYNEMKGAFSNPDDMLERCVMNSLFPDNAYGVESGGDPRYIPDLTREKYLEFHKRYYHPSNSYIYLYGDMDFEERLSYLDREYLSKYDAIDPKSCIKEEKSFVEPVKHRVPYSVAASADTAKKTYLTKAYVTGSGCDIETGLAFNMLDYALLSMPGAPLSKALLDAGIGSDISGGYEDGLLQNMFTITAKGADEKDLDRFTDIIDETLKNEVSRGIDKKSLEAAMNAEEFRFREADYGGYPKGLMYGLGMFNTWLYDDDMPFDVLKELDVIASLREKLDSGYFEDLVSRLLINNSHSSTVELVPKPGLTAENDKALSRALAKKKAAMTPEEIQSIVDDTAALKEYQSRPETEEALASIPMLKREDLRKEARPLTYKVERPGLIHTDIETNGIAYVDMMFRNIRLASADMSVLSFLLHVLGFIDTDRFSYAELSNEINLLTGGISVLPAQYTRKDSHCELTVQVRSKYLKGHSKDVLNLIDQILFHSHLDDRKRVKEILMQEKSGMEVMFQTSGHVVSATRCESYFSDAACIYDQMNGVGYYDYLKHFEENFDSEYNDFERKALELIILVFRPENLLLDIAGRGDVYREAESFIPVFEATLSAEGKVMSDRALSLSGIEKGDRLSDAVNKLNCLLPVPDCGPSMEVYGGRTINEGLMTPASIQYVSRCGDFRKAGYDYNGYMLLLKGILGYDYFWINIRVKGGAYGCMSSFMRSGSMRFMTYRDPNLKESLDIFEKTPDYLRKFDPDERTMTGYVISAFSDLDTPLTSAQYLRRDLTAYVEGYTDEDIQRTRDEVRSATAEDIRNLSQVVKDTLSQGYMCVVGNENKIKENEDIFGTIRDLI